MLFSAQVHLDKAYSVSVSHGYTVHTTGRRSYTAIPFQAPHFFEIFLAIFYSRYISKIID
jgi:hypothetical protein